MIEVGAMIVLAARAVVRGLRGPYDYMPEFVMQFRFVLTLALLPLLLTAFALSFGPAGIQASGFLGLLGALDRLGSTFELIVVREFAPLVTAIVVAGVAGTAICADLGARKVREELDALSVLGVDVIRGLVVPRLFALTLAAMTFNVFALAAGIVGAVVVTIENHAPVGPFFSTFFAAANTTELAASFLKCAIYGAVIAVVCCYKGMAASGGAEGVGAGDRGSSTGSRVTSRGSSRRSPERASVRVRVRPRRGPEAHRERGKDGDCDQHRRTDDVRSG